MIKVSRDDVLGDSHPMVISYRYRWIPMQSTFHKHENSFLLQRDADLLIYFSSWYWFQGKSTGHNVFFLCNEICAFFV